MRCAAASIFFELHGLESGEHMSPRTLILLYAADLHFRLRWQILPALDEGQTVVAAPYVET
jgi:thymidylate kinase